MSISRDILSDIIVFTKYARYDEKKGRRETWDEIVTRVKSMHIKKFPHLKDEIEEAFKYVYDKRVLPSMRMAQFAGKAVEINMIRGYNCGYLSMTHPDAFGELFLILLSGAGCGYSVQQHHVADLPPIRKPVSIIEVDGKKKRVEKTRRYLVADSIEGWAEAVKALVYAYFGLRKSIPEFDFSDVRPRGTKIKTGGQAPGPEPLKTCLHHIKTILDRKEDGEKLKPIEVHEINCRLAEAVLSGGVRRSSAVSLFSFDDYEMRTCKFGTWWEKFPHFAYANNSAVMLRHKINKEQFNAYFKDMKDSGAGEPGIFFSNNAEVGTNPCHRGDAVALQRDGGLIKIRDLQIGEYIWSESGWVQVTNIVSRGIRDTYKYETTAGSFYGTSNHNIVENGVKVEIDNAVGIDILSGNVSSSDEFDNQTIVDGLVIGDGMVHKASNNLVLLCIGKNDEDYFKSEIANFIGVGRPGINKCAYTVISGITAKELPRTYNRRIPERYLFGDTTTVRSFLRGLYTANGSICGNRVTLKASSKGLIEDVQLMLSSIGIRSYCTTNKEHDVTFKNGVYTCKQSYDLNISSDRGLFSKYIGFVQKYKNEALKKLINSAKSPVRPDKTTYDVTSKKYLGEDVVYDVTVNNKTHTFWCNGLNVANCGEISLKSSQFCNLVSVNTNDLTDQNEFNNRAKAAAFIATLQATYTDFHFLREEWKETTEEDALIGVSLSGIASGGVLDLDMTEAAKEVLKENERVAKLLGINVASRTTTVKPDGHSALLLGGSSGIHSWFSPYYIRRMRVMKNEPLYLYLKKEIPELVEDERFHPATQAVISIPIKAPEGAITRTETALQMLNRIAKVYKHWITPGYRKGDNNNNCSATVTIKPHEWERVESWLWENRDNYTAITVLPYDGGNYVQAPFEEITEEKYNELIKYVKQIDLTKIKENEDNTKLAKEIACSGGSCEIKEV